MKSIFFGLTLVNVATAQVVIGLSMMSDLGSSATAQPSSSSSGSSSAPNVSSGTSSLSSISAAPPSQHTPPPSSSTSFYQQMPYESYKSGGYKSLDCGYGYTKSSDGHCQPESWVSRLVYLTSSSLLYFSPQYNTQGEGCYATTIINHMYVA